MREIRVEEDSKYSEEEKPFQREMHLNDPNKLFVLEETQAIQRNMMRTRDINRKAYAFEESKCKRA